MKRRAFLSCLGLVPVAVAAPGLVASAVPTGHAMRVFGQTNDFVLVPESGSGRWLRLPDDWHNTPAEWTALEVKVLPNNHVTATAISPREFYT